MNFPKIDKNLLDLYLNSTTEGLYLLNDKMGIYYYNSRYLEITGGNRSLLKGSIPTSIQNGWHDPSFYNRMLEILERDGIWEDEVWDTNHETKALYVMNQKIIRYNSDGKVGYLGIVSDITTKLKILKELDFLEKIDQSTNVSNRFFGEKKLNDFLSENSDNVAVVLMDVNNFSIIPETFGHLQADEVLKEIASRLKSCMNSENLFSFVKDRFVLYFTYEETEEIEDRAYSIIDAFYEPFTIGENEFFITVNLGVSLYNSDGTESESLIKNADSAMQESRKESFNTFSFYEAKMNAAVLEQFQILGDLRKSIERDELHMVYQPQVNCFNNQVSGAEALIRWNNRERGPISPVDFIPLAEDKGLIIPIGEWVLRNSCNEFLNWKENNINDVSMAINISGGQFNDKRLVPLIRNLFYDKVDTSKIELEITESAFVDDVDNSIRILHRLKDMGFALAIDDFGTGYSSLSYLKRFPIDKLKIDKSFIDNILFDEGDKAIVKTIISLAQYLDLKVIAEGVETKEQRDLLIDLNCLLIQGYYYSKPIPGDKFINFHNEMNNI